MVWFKSREPDPLHTVSSVVKGYRYHCPDVAAVDRHIAELRAAIGKHSNLSRARQEAWRRDIDRLLDRRCYLKVIG